jgi:hypothetical protein
MPTCACACAFVPSEVPLIFPIKKNTQILGMTSGRTVLERTSDETSHAR